MPHRGFGGLLTNAADQAGFATVPLEALQLLKKQCCLQSPFPDTFGPQFAPRESENHLEDVLKELSQAVQVQTKVLVEFLEALRERSTH